MSSSTNSEAVVAPLVRYLTSQSVHNAHSVGLHAHIDQLGSIEDGKQILNAILKPGADIGRVKLIWPLLSKKYGNPIIMEWVKLWKRQADETAKANRRVYEATHLLAIFDAIFSEAEVLKLFADQTKFRDSILPSIFNLLENHMAPKSGAPRDRAQEVGVNAVRKILKKSPKVFDMVCELIQNNHTSAKYATAAIEVLAQLAVADPKLTKLRAALFEYYDKLILSVRNKVSLFHKSCFAPLLAVVDQTEFNEKLWPIVTRQLKRSPDSSDVVLHLFSNLNKSINMNVFASTMLSIVSDYIQSADEEVRRNCAGIVTSVVARTSDAAVVPKLFEAALALVNAGSTNWYARLGSMNALAAIGRHPEAPKSLVEKASPVLLKVLEKETNLECLQATLNTVALYFNLDATKLSERAVSILLKGSADKDHGKLYLLALYNAVANVAANKLTLEPAVISAIAKALIQTILSAKVKVAIAPEAMISSAVLVTLAATDANLDKQLQDEKVWAALLSAQDSFLFNGSPSLIERLTSANDANSLQAFGGLMSAMLRFHFDKVSPLQNIFSLLINLMTSEKSMVRQAAISTVSQLHPHVPTLSAKLLELFQNETLPALCTKRAAVGYLEELPAQMRTVLRCALDTIVSKSLLESNVEANLCNLFLVAHHPLLMKHESPTGAWQRSVVQQLQFASTDAVYAKYSDALIDTLFSTAALKSTDAFKRAAAVNAATSLLHSERICNSVLDRLSELMDTRPYFALTKDEIGVIRVPAGKVYKQPQLAEYIPEFKVDKNIKSNDDEVEAQKKINEARRKHQAMIDEKLRKIETEQLAVEEKIRQRVYPTYSTLLTAIETVTVAAKFRPCLNAFSERDAVFLFNTVERLTELFNDDLLAEPAIRAMRVLIHHLIPTTHAHLRSLLTRCITTVIPAAPLPRPVIATPTVVKGKKTAPTISAAKQRELDEAALAEKRQALASLQAQVVAMVTSQDGAMTTKMVPNAVPEEDTPPSPSTSRKHKATAAAVQPLQIDAPVWSLLQVVFGSVFTPLHPVEIQESSLHEIQRHLTWVSQRLVNVLVGVIANAPVVADDAKVAVIDMCANMNPLKPVHHSAVASLVKHASLNPNPDVRRALLVAIRKAGGATLRAFEQYDVVVPHLWMAKFDLEDAESDAARIAAEIYDDYTISGAASDEEKLSENYFAVLSSPLNNPSESVRSIAARALVGAMALFPDTQAATYASLLAIYTQHHPALTTQQDPVRGPSNVAVVETADALNWRRGVAAALRFSGDLASLGADQLVVIFKFLVETAIYDVNNDVYDRFLQAGIELLNKRGGASAEITAALQPLLESYLSSNPPQTERQHRARQSIVVFLGTFAQHLVGASAGGNEAAAERIMDKLMEVLQTPSEPVQRSVAQCLTALAPRLSQETNDKLLRRCFNMVMNPDNDYGQRRGGAYGIAGVIRGLKVPSLRKYPWLMEQLEQAAGNKDSEVARQGASLTFECLSLLLGRFFEPWVIKLLPHLLNSLGDNSTDVRESTAEAARAIMSQLSGNGINLVLPAMLRALDSTERGSKWRAKAGAIDLLGSMAYCQPEQLGQCLPTIIPKLSALLADTHNQVQKAARDALNAICGTIRNPEISKIVPVLLKAIDDPVQHTSTALEALAHTHFVNRIDAPSMSLLMPILDRALKDRHTENKKNATKIVGSMVSLTEPGALKPYLKSLIEHLKAILSDPIPQTRTAAAIALGLVARGLDAAADVVPTLLDTMKSDVGAIERSGAAQGLAHVIAYAVDLNSFKVAMLPRILSQCAPPATASARQGYLSLFQYLPESLGHRFEILLQLVLPTVIRGLADETEAVRDAALKAGQSIVARFGDEDKVDLVIPTLQHAMFNDNWRIRTSSTQLLSELLYKISGADQSFADKDIAPMLSNRDRQATLATLYVLRQDLNAVVRQNAGHVWKLLVVNTPKTLRTILPMLMDILIEQLSADDEDKREISSKTLGEIVEKLGDRVLGDILPILDEELKASPHPTTRVGVILGITEILAASRDSVGPFIDSILVPSIRSALCDANNDVRDAASLAFDELYKCINEKAIDDILPPLLTQMEDSDAEKSELALHGLQQMLTKRSALILPSIIPKLTAPGTPLSAFNAKALASIAEVAADGFHPFLRDILSIFMKRLFGINSLPEPIDEDTKLAVERSLHRIAVCMKGPGLNVMFTQLYGYMTENNPQLRAGAMDLIGAFCREAKARQGTPYAPPSFDEHLPNLIQCCLRGFNDPFMPVVETALKSLTAVMSHIVVKDDATTAGSTTNYVQSINDALETLGLVEGATLRGFNLPGGLTPILPMYLQVLRTGSQDEREQSALGIRLMLELTEQAQLKPYLTQITGPLIRILAERTLSTNTRSAMLQTLNQVVTKGGVALRPFAAQLQTTYVKALGATTKGVRDQAATGVKLLLSLGAKADFLIKDLIKQMRDPNTPAPDACLDAVIGVLKTLPAAPGSLASTSVNAIREAATPLLSLQDATQRHSAARTLGVTCRFSEDEEIFDFVRSSRQEAVASGWLEIEAGMVMLRELFSDATREQTAIKMREEGLLFPFLTDMLKHNRVSVRVAAVQCIGAVMILLADSDEKLIASLADRLAEMLSDESSDVKIASLVAIKEFAKQRSGHCADQLKVLVPPIMNRVKDKKVLQVKFAAERALLHVLQIKLDPKMPLLEHYASEVYDKEWAKLLVDYCKRVLSKLPQFSEDEEDGGEGASMVGGDDY